MKKREFHKERIVSIDFDGVLSKYDGWKGEENVDEPIEGSRDFVIMLIKCSYVPVIFTARKKEVVENWLKIYNFPEIEVTNVKYPSVAYIDDRCVKFDGNFSELFTNLKEFDVYWRNKENKIFNDLKKKI